MFASVAMTLGDAFNRRKKLAADLQSWIGRLGLAEDVIDRIGEFAQRVKQAINQANKTELAELD